MSRKLQYGWAGGKIAIIISFERIQELWGMRAHGFCGNLGGREQRGEETKASIGSTNIWRSLSHNSMRKSI